MKPIVKNIIGVVTGLIVGNVINLTLVQLGSSILPIPGVDPNDLEALAEAAPNLEAKYFIFPFLAHALGTLSGAFITALIAASYKRNLAMLIGVFFLLAGIAVNFMVPGPFWFSAVDILLAYLPMAWLGYRLALRLQKKK
ncbi:hypothetical protein [Nonlabens xiamenensis]|uniref:hypothetical protein n=1 Tax=Nonlabens xiamenensis TaxID=2341043 RepID=UPI000F60A274|nr:hypothetical protein [Nonlabens xiamenensis]